VVFLFSEKFLPSTKLIIPLAIATLFQGLNQPPIRFLTVHQQGNYQRNAAIMISICNFVTNLIFVPIYGAFGAALASAISRFFGFVTNHYYYYKTVLHLNSRPFE
jgi:O-antigen/teichoic acid export membrane protein